MISIANKRAIMYNVIKVFFLNILKISRGAISWTIKKKT